MKRSNIIAKETNYRPHQNMIFDSKIMHPGFSVIYEHYSISTQPIISSPWPPGSSFRNSALPARVAVSSISPGTIDSWSRLYITRNINICERYSACIMRYLAPRTMAYCSMWKRIRILCCRISMDCIELNGEDGKFIWWSSTMFSPPPRISMKLTI